MGSESCATILGADVATLTSCDLMSESFPPETTLLDQEGVVSAGEKANSVRTWQSTAARSIPATRDFT